VLSGAIGATVFTAIAGTTILANNEKKLTASSELSSSITWARAIPINFVAKNLISVSECHAAGDSCCKEATTTPVVSEKPKESVSKVIEVTTESFQQVVLKSDKDVFVVFYAPWCGYCKRLGENRCCLCLLSVGFVRFYAWNPLVYNDGVYKITPLI